MIIITRGQDKLEFYILFSSAERYKIHCMKYEKKMLPCATHVWICCETRTCIIYCIHHFWGTENIFWSLKLSTMYGCCEIFIQWHDIQCYFHEVLLWYRYIFIYFHCNSIHTITCMFFVFVLPGKMCPYEPHISLRQKIGITTETFHSVSTWSSRLFFT